MRLPRLAVCAIIPAALMVACLDEHPTDDGAPRATGSGLTVCPATNVVANPPQFQWTYHAASPTNPEAYYSGTLEVGQATFTIGSGTLTTRAYRQAGGSYTIPGPTITVAPGNKYVLRFRNTLPYEPMSAAMNVFKDPNVSNVHTHGLHISGESPSDDVTRAFEGQRGGDFVWDIPDDHMGGTYWYHAHHHGSSFLQVSGGLFGLLVVDDAGDGVPSNVRAMAERQLVIAYLDPAARGTGGDTLMSGTLSSTWTVNGTVQGALCMPQGEWQHWRILLADRDSTEKTLGVGPNCEVQMMARDGVWRTTAPKALTTRQISMPAASRVDLAVRCSNDSTITVNGATVANVFVNGAGNTSVGPFSNGATGSTWSAIRPAYLRDLRGVSQVNKVTINMGARTINGSKYDHHVPNLSLPPTQVQEWTIKGSTQHPFHLHVYHVQSLNCGGDFEAGEYYDVISQGCAVRFDLNAATTNAYEGRTIMHCHILEHEDQGAMGWMDVLGGLAPPTFPADQSVAYSEYYSLGGGPTPSCGDGTCNGSETRCSCPGDCGAAPTVETSCTNGVSDDCDGLVDCADTDCAADSACVTTCDNDGLCEVGEDCTSCGGDCPSVTSGSPSKRYCCGDGVAQSAEGNGSICDGNY